MWEITLQKWFRELRSSEVSEHRNPGNTRVWTSSWKKEIAITMVRARDQGTTKESYLQGKSYLLCQREREQGAGLGLCQNMLEAWHGHAWESAQKNVQNLRRTGAIRRLFWSCCPCNWNGIRGIEDGWTMVIAIYSPVKWPLNSSALSPLDFLD